MKTDAHKKDFANEAMILTVMNAILGKLRGEAWKIQDFSGVWLVILSFSKLAYKINNHIQKSENKFK